MRFLNSVRATHALVILVAVAAPTPALAAGLAQAGGQAGKLVAFFESLLSGLQLIGVAMGVLMAAWAGIKIATGQRDGMEKLVYAGIGVFVLLMAKPIIDLVQAATR